MSGETKRIRKAAPERGNISAPYTPVDAIGAPAPHSPEVERAVLSAVMMDETAQAWGIAQQCGVKAKAFYSAANRRIWQVVEDLRAAGSACTPIEVLAELQATAELEDVGGADYLAKIGMEAVTTAQIRYHAEQLVLLRQRRIALEISAEIAQAAQHGFESREKFAGVLGDAGQKIIRFGRREQTRTLEEQIEAVQEDMKLRSKGAEDRSNWVCTGLPTFDRRLKPLNSARLDGLTVIGGGSGHGKSAIGRQIVWNCLERGGSAVVYTRETDIESFIEQMVATVARVDLNNPEQVLPESLALFDSECTRLRTEVANKRLWVFQNEPATPLEKVEQLQQHYRAHAHLHGHPRMVMVDYLQIFGTEKRCGNREEVVATVSHTIQAIQRESGNLWLVLAQLNESGLRDMKTLRRDANDKVIHRTPGAGDIRESQAIFHDADRVVMLYRPPVDCRDSDNWGGNTLKPEIWLCQIKRRKGGEGNVRCWFEKKYTHFQELERAEVIQGEAGMATGGAVPEGGQDKAKWLEEQRKKRGGAR